METATDTFLGFDPGGKTGFGAAILAGSQVATVTVSTVAEALDCAVERCGTSAPVAAGVVPSSTGVMDRVAGHLPSDACAGHPLWQ
jgi:hypothetical protein